MQATLPLPKWIMQRYSVLWVKFGLDNFTYADASACLNKDSMLSIVLSGLRKNGWLGVQLNQNDARKRLYNLKSPNDAIREMASRANVRVSIKKKAKRNE